MTAFDGPAGLVTALVMARMNADMERAALDLLEPCDGERFVVIGFGPGVGLTELLDRCRPASVIAADPSAVMGRVARRRLRRHPHRDVVSLMEVGATRLDLEPERVDAAIAVNTHQLWAPHLATALVLARGLRPGGRLVTVTHEWAITKVQPIVDWKQQVTADLRRAGFDPPSWSVDDYRSGAGVSLQAAKTEDLS